MVIQVGLATCGPAMEIGRAQLNNKPCNATRSLRYFIAPAVFALGLCAGLAPAQCLPRYEFKTQIQSTACGQNTNTLGAGIAKDLVVGFFECLSGTDHAFQYTTGGGYANMVFPPGTAASLALDCTDAQAITGLFDNSAYEPDAQPFLRQNNMFVALGAPKPSWTTAAQGNAVNMNNVVVGEWGNNITGPIPLAFLWDGQMYDLSQDLIGKNSTANDISDTGLVTGWMGTGANVDAQAYIWNQGKVAVIPPLGNAFSMEGRAINNLGHVAGTAWIPADNNPGFIRKGFYYDGKNVFDIGEPPGGGPTNTIVISPQSMTDDGTVVGGAGNAPCGLCAFVYKAGMMANLNALMPPGSEWTTGASAISSTGEITGWIPSKSAQQVLAYWLTPIGPRPGDVNCDDVVNVTDLLGVIDAWGDCGRPGSFCPGDLDFNRTVNVDDLLMVINDWG